MSYAERVPSPKIRVTHRDASPDVVHHLTLQGVDPLLARLYAARGVQSSHELHYDLSSLLPFDKLLGIELAAERLAFAIHEQENILIIADYDADGATACAVGMRGLRLLGAQVDFLVPNRFEYGYGLTPELVDLAVKTRRPDLIITVDNGISSAEGVAHAKRYGIETIVTDHHLAGDVLPECVIVNPNQPGCHFASKSIAGVGVMFYVLLALRAHLRNHGFFAQRTEPNLAHLLDLVALGTVADVVRLDHNNRILVSQGLARIRSGRCCAGIRALLLEAKRDPDHASVFDLGYVLGPRINAAGRLDDMSVGIACLISDDPSVASVLAHRLSELNQERRGIEKELQEDILHNLTQNFDEQQHSISVLAPDGHHGVIGIVASRLKDQYHRPVMVFAPSDQGDLRVSGRSIAGFHLRDALDLIHKRHPGLILRFGGHAAAAGATVRGDGFGLFSQAFEAIAQEMLDESTLKRQIVVDGALEGHQFDPTYAELLEQHVWGQGFPAPSFINTMTILQQRLVGHGQHLKLDIEVCGQKLEAMMFRQDELLSEPSIDACYQISLNQWKGTRRTNLIINQIV
jgi:single-stranded-DNA-specific exonuclease